MSFHYGMSASEIAALPHDNRAKDTITAVVLCMTFATMAVCCRLYTRYFVLRKFWLDDLLAIAGMFAMITNGVVQCVHTKYGLGAHIYDIKDPEQIISFWKTFYALSISYNTSLMIVKFTLFFQYYRLIQEVPYYRLYYLIAMTVVGAWVISQEFILIFPCTPIEYYWNQSVGGTCINTNITGWMNAIGNIVTDLIVLVLPIPVVWRLNLNRGRKWAVLGIFALGFFTCIVSICRMVFFAKVSDDLSYDLVPVAAWGEAESASGLICSSLIALGPLIHRVSRHFRSTKKKSSTPQKFSFGGTNPFSRHTTVRDKSLRTNGSRKPFGDGSETELNRLDLDPSRKDMQDDGRSIRSIKSSGLEAQHNDYTGVMPDLKLGLGTGIQTIISSGNRDSMHSQTIPIASQGIVVKQVWSVQNREPDESDD